MVTKKRNRPEVVRADLPRFYGTMLEEFAKQHKLSKSFLLSIALDNEMTKKEPFKVSTELDKDVEYVEYAYIDEAGEILKFIRKNPGYSKEWLMVARHEIGVHDRDTFLLAWRELEKKDFIEEYVKYSRTAKIHFKAWRVKGEKG